MSLVVNHNLELEQMDITTTFLYETLDDNIFMKQSLKYEVADKRDMVCHFKKLIYGLKHSSRQWNRCFDSFITSKGLVKNSYDSCVYEKTMKANISVLLLLYVDDILIASNSSQ